MRLIDADVLKADYGMADDCKNCKTGWRSCQGDNTYTKMNFCGWLDDAPTVDAVPVRHGRWETVEDWDGDERYKCSVCGDEWFLEVGNPEFNNMNYCPKCGARMDGEGNGNETDRR